MMQLLALDASKVWAQEPLYERELRAYCARYPEEGFRDLQYRAAAGDIEFFIVWDTDRQQSQAIVVGQFLPPGADGRVTFYLSIVAGRGSRRWVHLLPDLEAYAKSKGAYRMRAAPREGWLRLGLFDDYRKAAVVVEKVL
jgi:hypothetical protein